jgi:hypothetical protein
VAVPVAVVCRTACCGLAGCDGASAHTATAPAAPSRSNTSHAVRACQSSRSARLYAKERFWISSAYRPPSAAWLRSSKNAPKRSGEMAVPDATVSPWITVPTAMSGAPLVMTAPQCARATGAWTVTNEWGGSVRTSP